MALLPNYELKLISNGYSKIVGIDEVGRGCLAGPVAVGAYLYQKSNNFIEGINDSKKLSLKKREKIQSELSKHTYSIHYGSPLEIDRLGIAKTIENLIIEIINKYNSEETYFLIDGVFSQNFGENSEKIIKGDSTYYSIAAASILAKVERDRLMEKLHNKYPVYGLARHKGYGTKQHRDAIKLHGLCDLHRKSWKI